MMQVRFWSLIGLISLQLWLGASAGLAQTALHKAELNKSRRMLGAELLVTSDREAGSSRRAISVSAVRFVYERQVGACLGSEAADWNTLNPDLMLKRVIGGSEAGVVVQSWCTGPAGSNFTVRTVPPPPGAAEVADAIGLPEFDIATSPIRRGLTGLETWFWCDAPTTESVTVSIRGYRVVAEAHAVEFEWVTGDGHSYFSDTCGEEPDPEGDGYGAAARHTYETKDFYALELRIGWSGSYTFSGHGRRRTGDLGGVTTISSRRYPVSEVRAVLVD
jgi:hypothetical protein